VLNRTAGGEFLPSGTGLRSSEGILHGQVCGGESTRLEGGWGRWGEEKPSATWGAPEAPFSGGKELDSSKHSGAGEEMAGSTWGKSDETE